MQQGDDLPVDGVEPGPAGTVRAGSGAGVAQPPALLEVLVEERTERGEQPGAVHDERHGFALALRVEGQQGDAPVDDDQLDGHLVGDDDVLALSHVGGQRGGRFGTFEPVTLDDAAHDDPAPGHLVLDLVVVVLEGEHRGHPSKRQHGAHLADGLALHQQESAPDRRGPRQHLDGRARGMGLGGAVPLGEVGDEGFDAVQGGAAGFEEGTEGEHRRGGAVARRALVGAVGVGQAALDQEVEGARHFGGPPRRRVCQRVRITVGPVDEEPVDGALPGAQAELGEQGRVRGVRSGKGAARRMYAVGSQRPALVGAFPELAARGRSAPGGVPSAMPASALPGSLPVTTVSRPTPVVLLRR